MGRADAGAQRARPLGQTYQVRDDRAKPEFQLLEIDADDAGAALPGPGHRLFRIWVGPGEDGKKPLHWFDVPSRPIFAFAGIWRPTERGNAYGFPTTEPNAVVASIHPKAMPVILHDEDYGRWLTAPWDELKKLAAPYPSQLMKAFQ